MNQYCLLIVVILKCKNCLVLILLFNKMESNMFKVNMTIKFLCVFILFLFLYLIFFIYYNGGMQIKILRQGISNILLDYITVLRQLINIFKYFFFDILKKVVFKNINIAIQENFEIMLKLNAVLCFLPKLENENIKYFIP